MFLLDALMRIYKYLLTSIFTAISVFKQRWCAFFSPIPNRTINKILYSLYKVVMFVLFVSLLFIECFCLANIWFLFKLIGEMSLFLSIIISPILAIVFVIINYIYYATTLSCCFVSLLLSEERPLSFIELVCE